MRGARQSRGTVIGGGCKPDSVPWGAASIHLGRASPRGSSGRPGSLTRRSGIRRWAILGFPTWPCSAWGLPCPHRHRWSGALLPHPFTLTSGPCTEAVCSLRHFPSRCRGRALPGMLPIWSPDFPLPVTTGSGRPPPPIAPSIRRRSPEARAPSWWSVGDEQLGYGHRQQTGPGGGERSHLPTR